MKKYYKLIAAGLVLVLVIYFVFFNKVSTSQGIAYIKNQESLKVEDVQKTFKKMDKKEKIQLLDSGDVSAFSLFSDYVFFGDSRVVGFANYGYLDANRIFASTDASISTMAYWKDSLSALKPSYIIISYGPNDLLAGYDPQDYKEIVVESIQAVVAVCPSAEIYVNSIISVTPSAAANNELWSNLDAYNTVLKEACSENKWTFIDNSKLSDGSEESGIYEYDGVHFTSGFYESWADKIIRTVLS